MTLHEGIQQFLGMLKDSGKSPATIVAYNKDLAQLEDFLKNIDLKKVTTENINDFLQTLLSEGMTPKTVSRKLNSIKSLSKFLVKNGELLVDPSKPISHLKLESKLPRILTEAEYKALREMSKESVRLYTIVELMLQTGMRIGEISRVKLEDIVMKNNTGQILVKEFASNSMRIVELNKTSQDSIKAYLDGHRQQNTKDQGYLFNTKNGGNMNIRNIRSAVDRIFKRAEIKNATVNDLRNTFIAFQLNKGISLEKLAQVVGHKRFSSTEKYLQIMKRSKPGRSMKVFDL